MLRLAILVTGLVGLSACQFFQPGETADTVPVEAASDTADTDTIMETASVPSPHPVLEPFIVQESEVMFGEAEFPPELTRIAPTLDSRLRADARAEFAQVEADARQYEEVDPDYFRPYRVGITWELLGAVGDLVSLDAFFYYDTGGAHPNYLIGGLIHQVETAEDLYVMALFEDEAAAEAALYPLLRAEVLRQKKERYTEVGIPLGEAEAEIAQLFDGNSNWFRETALAASTEDGKFGGMTVYFSPYELGTYAEGAYRATIPQAAFRDMLKPDYAPLFGGDPKPDEEDE